MSLYSYSQPWNKDYHIVAYTPCIQRTYSKATELQQRVQQGPISHEDLPANNAARAAQVHAPTAQ